MIRTVKTIVDDGDSLFKYFLVQLMMMMMTVYLNSLLFTLHQRPSDATANTKS